MALRPHRQRLTLSAKAGTKGKPVVLEDAKTLSAYGLKEGDAIVVKDLGPQISWRTVFCIEYLGPLVIHQLFFLTRLNSSQVMSFTQVYARPPGCWPSSLPSCRVGWPMLASHSTF